MYRLNIAVGSAEMRLMRLQKYVSFAARGLPHKQESKNAVRESAAN